jgi:hypothetical protein
MPLFLTQVSYTQQAWQSLVESPQNRLEVVRVAVEKLGGKVVNGWRRLATTTSLLFRRCPIILWRQALQWPLPQGVRART